MEQGALPAEVLAEARQALAAWKLKDGAWRLVGTVPGSRGAIMRPVVEIGDARYVLQRQPPDLTLADARFRHAFMTHLRAADLPVQPAGYLVLLMPIKAPQTTLPQRAAFYTKTTLQ